MICVCWNISSVSEDDAEVDPLKKRHDSLKEAQTEGSVIPEDKDGMPVYKAAFIWFRLATNKSPINFI